MILKYANFFCVLLLFVDAAFVKRDTTAQSTSNLDALKKNMDDFKNCIDKSLANVVGEVNEDHLKPLFSVIGDQLNRFSKAFDALTKPSSPQSSPDESEINI